MAFCSYCGKELSAGAKFCFECGKPVEMQEETARKTVYSGEIHKCPRCGEVLNAYEAYCSACGYEIRGSSVSGYVQKFAEQVKTATTEYQKASIIQSFPVPNNREDIFEFLILATSSIDRHLNKAVLTAWVSKIEQSYRKAKLMLHQQQDLEQVEEIYEAAQEKIRELNHEKIQTKKTPSLPREPEKKRFWRWTPMTTVGMALGFMIILTTVLVMSSKDSPKPNEPTTAVTDRTPEQNEPEGQLRIGQGEEYTCGVDTSNLYLATAVTDSVIKIEKWERGLSFKNGYAERYEVGAYKINDPQHGFRWLDSEHSAFEFIVQDSRFSEYSKGKKAIFTVSWTNDNVNKGANGIGDVHYYENRRSESYLYKAIPLPDDLIKIECWYRMLGLGDFYYGYDVCILDLNSTDHDFSWSDEEHSSFTLTMQDPQNPALKAPTFVAFEGKS